MYDFDVNNTRIDIARENFKKGIVMDETYVRSIIMESWLRCKGMGLEFDRANKQVISREALQSRIEARRTFCDIAFQFMESLTVFTTGSGFLSLVCDEEGYVLKMTGDDDIMRLATENRFVEGCNRKEESLGTNGIGTCLAIGKPIQVFAKEHYYRLHQNWVCSGAPIFDADGKTIGCICLTGTYDKASFHTLGMAAAAAEAITRQLKMKQAYDALDQIKKKMNVIVETVPSGVMLLDRDLSVVQNNARAAKLFNRSDKEMEGEKLGALMQLSGIDSQEMENGFEDKYVSAVQWGRHLNLLMSLRPANNDGYVVILDKPETAYKKARKLVGSEAYFTFRDIIGQSPELTKSIRMANVVADNTSNVLLYGESGTGKELFAQAIHNASPHRDGPFVAFNCGALPKSLVESELFGYESGSFTGARRDGCAGKFEQANGGTIFLDEIGEMPFDVQVSLLRVLQNREVIRIGGNKAIKVNVRIIAATNKDLLQAIDNNTFRRDLYYRLNVFCINIPPLRERTGDIRLLANYFLQKYSDHLKGGVREMSEEAYQMLEWHNWPGNVRELENVIERTVYLTGDGRIEAEHLPDSIPRLSRGLGNAALPGGIRGDQLFGSSADSPIPPPPEAAARKELLTNVLNEQQRIEQALIATGGNVKRAAMLLSISRRTLYRKLEKHQLDPKNIRSEPFYPAP